MAPVRSFAPLANAQARVLILGSMPGVQSLAAGQYYANPHNAFWRILGAHLGMPADADYRLRVRLLKAAGIAVWDVLETCHRPGSLDADIAADTLVTNDFGRFLAQHRQIRQVFFNGATAEKFYRQRVLPTLATGAIAYQRLPSTSPAHASLRFEQKRAVWLAALRAAL